MGGDGFDPFHYHVDLLAMRRHRRLMLGLARIDAVIDLGIFAVAREYRAVRDRLYLCVVETQPEESGDIAQGGRRIGG